MRLSEWRAEAPARASVEAKVVGVLEPVLTALGAGRDPHGWAAWGDDVVTRWQYFAPTHAGLVHAFVRVNVPGEGPRATGKLIRWGRVQLGELAIEMQGGHRLLSFSVEGQILKGADARADGIAAFALVLFGAIDGRVADFDIALGGPGGKRPARAAAAGGEAGAAKAGGAARSAKPKAGGAGSGGSAPVASVAAGRSAAKAARPAAEDATPPAARARRRPAG